MAPMTRLLHRIFAFRPCKPRSPLLRVMLGLMGVAVLALLVVFGLVLGLGMLLFAASRRLLRPATPTATHAQVIDGEYSVVRSPSAPSGNGRNLQAFGLR